MRIVRGSCENCEDRLYRIVPLTVWKPRMAGLRRLNDTGSARYCGTFADQERASAAHYQEAKNLASRAAHCGRLHFFYHRLAANPGTTHPRAHPPHLRMEPGAGSTG